VTPLPLTRWDAHKFVRSAAVSLLAFGMACLVTAATDEGGVAWGERAGRTLPVIPVCAAIGVWVALAPARARGEGRAMAALGRSRLQVGAAAVSGAALVCAVAAVTLVASSRLDVNGFFPTAPRVSTWRWSGRAFVDASRGAFVGEDGAPQSLATVASPSPSPADAPEAAPSVVASIPAHGRGAAALALGVAGLAVPLLLAHAMLVRPSNRRLGRQDATAAAAAIGSVAASVILFQASAVRHLPAVLGAVPPLALLAFVLQRYRAVP
jgi:hypothetical protein